MLSHIAEWAATVLAVGVIAGLVVLAAAAGGLWWLYRRIRRRLETFTSTAVRYARQAAGAATAGRVSPPVMAGHHRPITGPPGGW